jgi:hypothetical protein
MRPPKPPIVHRLEARRASRPDDRDEIGPMVWAAVAVAIAGLCAIVVWGGPT